MTLFRQLFAAVSLLFLVLMIVIDISYVNNSRVYLQEQLTSHSQDVATSLGLVLPAAMEVDDGVKMQTTVGAIFDRGYYQSIRVVSVRGETLLLRELAPGAAEVPVWFADQIKLSAPTAESLITKGWRQMGRVIVSSHPNFAYRQLWATTKSATLWLLAVYVLSLILLHLFLRTILKPLKEIESAANSISNREFATVKHVPRARELRSVVGAINSLSTKVKHFITQEIEIASHYREEAYQDPLTQLSNRRGFEQQISGILALPANAESGVLFMIHLPGFDEFNASQGYVQGDKLLIEVAQAIAGVSAGSALLTARIAGVTFVVAGFNLSRAESERLGEGLCQALHLVCGKWLDRHAFGCGGVYFGTQRKTLAALMAEADAAMLSSIEVGQGQLVLREHHVNDGEVVKGSQFWKQFITDALAHDRTALFIQPVISFAADARVLQNEITGRLCSEDGEIVPAVEFMTMASRHQLVAAIDRKLIEKLVLLLAERPNLTGQIAINLSIRSLHDAALVSWILDTLKANRELAKRIVFEFAEYSIVQDLVLAGNFVAGVRQLGANFAVDNFGLHYSAFEYLQTLRPAYIKLGASYIQGIEHAQEQQFFVSSVVKITRPLEILTIAHGVETTEQFSKLKQLGVDGYQGYAAGAPVRLDHA